MAWRFKASKYKNAAPIVPKPEMCVRDIIVGSYQNYGNNIAASGSFMAFNWEHAGTSVAVLPLDDCGRKSKTMPLLYAHSDTVTDLEFSPFHDGLLATGSLDCQVKIWHIPEQGLTSAITNPECTFSHKQRRIERVGFHPTADYLLHSVSAGTTILWDMNAQDEIYCNNDHPEVIQSICWKRDGTLLSTTCKDKIVRIMDPRASTAISMSADNHQSIKDSRVVWMGDQNRILTTGFDAARLRQVIVRDLRYFNKPEKTLELDCSTGILMPLFDADTNMLFLAGKGDSTITYLEVTDKEPFFIEGLRHSGEQTKGACLVPKRALRVMEGEVNRVMQLTSNSVVPIMYQVPRKTYRDFHADLYPDTVGFKTDLTATQWMMGKNIPVPKMSLDPAKREAGPAPISPRLGPKPFVTSSANETFSFDKVFAVPTVPGTEVEPNDRNGTKNGSVEEVEEIVEETTSPDIALESTVTLDPVASAPAEEEKNASVEYVEMRPPLSRSNSDEVDDNVCRESISIADRRKMYEFKSMSIQAEKVASPTPLRRQNSCKQTNGKSSEEKIIMAPPPTPVTLTETSANDQSNGKRTSTVFGRVSKFRHLKGTPGHKSTQIDNVRNISRQLGGECDGFHANYERVAVPLAGPGGKIAVYELSKTGRLPDGVIPSLVNGSNVMDFQWDPFNSKRLAVACDDGTVKFWIIPDGGLTEPINTPDLELVAHTDKIFFIKFHPCAKDVLLTASYDMTMKIWNTNDVQRERICLIGHTDQIFSFAWSPCGTYGATVCRDGKVRIYNPRKSVEPIQEGAGPVGTRGARIVWAIDGEYIVVTGFDKVSERQISVYKKSNIKTPLNTIGLDVTPAILIPFYDEDSSTLFVTGKGDSTIFTFDITDESPYVCPLSHHRAGTSHQGLSFLMKNQCNVSVVEFAKALRLTNNTIECLSFTVPRLKSELFQDDLFPPTRVTWNATMTAEEWFDVNVKDKVPIKISLQPEGMASLSSSRPTTATVAQTSLSTDKDPMDFNPNRPAFADSRKQKEQDLKKALSSRMEVNLSKVVHDTENGVEDKEWDEN